MTNLTIRRLESLPEKEAVIAACDGAFPNPVRERPIYRTLLHKIHTFGIFFAAYDPQPVGYAAMYANDRQTRTAFMTLLAVKPASQGAGIGRKLMEQCLRTAAGTGMEWVRLEVNKENRRGIALYEAYGFRPDGQETEHTIFMTKSLV